MARALRTRGSTPLVIGTVAFAGVAAVLLFNSKTAAARPTDNPSTGHADPQPSKDHTPPPAAPRPPNDVVFGEAPFPPQKAGHQWERLQRLADVAESVTGMADLYSYLVATARKESNGVPSAKNTKTDAEPAFRLFCRKQNYQKRYRDNPWKPAECTAADPRSARWAYSGGLFQIMPAVALATADRYGHKQDPARVFDPPFAVAYAADLVYRIKRGSGAKTWGDIRAGWALPSWAKPDSTSPGKQKTLARFNKTIAKVLHMGVRPDLATSIFSTERYPGFANVLHAMLVADGRVKPATA